MLRITEKANLRAKLLDLLPQAFHDFVVDGQAMLVIGYDLKEYKEQEILNAWNLILS